MMTPPRCSTGRHWPRRDDLRRIAVPTRILAWSGDGAHPVSTAEELAALIPGAELQVASTAADLQTWTAAAAAELLART